jgi:opacity protein-like surface antigen
MHRFVLPLALLPAPASADPLAFYLKGFGGVSSQQGDALSLDGASERSADFGAGSLAGAAIGWAYADSPWRAEVEFAYRSADADDLPGALGDGDNFASTALMLNGIYDFDRGGRWTPYVGAGIGAATEVDLDIDRGAGEEEFSSGSSFAWQAFGGVGYAVSDRVSLFGEVRYFTVPSAELDGPGGAVLDVDYETVELLTGITWRF